MCNVNSVLPPLGFGGNYADGLVVKRSLDRGFSFTDACAICGPDAAGVGATDCDGTGNFSGTVDAPDLFFDPDENALYAAWQGRKANNSYYKKNVTPGSSWCAWNPKPAQPTASITTLNQQFPSIATFPSGQTVPRLLIAYTTPAGPSRINIGVSFVDPPQQSGWTDLVVDGPLDTTSYVAGGRIKHAPRPRLLRARDTLLLAYAAYNVATATNEIRVKRSTDGGATWTTAPLPAAPAGNDRFFPALSGRWNVREAVLVFYESQASQGGALVVQASDFDFFATQWTPPSQIASGAGVPFLPCTLSTPTNDKFYGEYVGTAGALGPNGFGNHYPAWADSRRGAFSDVVGAKITE